MKRHTKIYMDYFGYDGYSFIPCEVCGCRADHEKFGDKKQYKDYLRQTHERFISKTEKQWKRN